MRHWALGLLLVALAETAALACSCVPPPSTRAEAVRAAQEVARRAVAVVEADVVAGYDEARSRGEQVRVRRVLAGRAPPVFRVHRRGRPNSASCGLELGPRQRVFLVLYPAVGGAAGEFAIQSLCTDYYLRDPAFRSLLVTQVRRRR